MQFGQIYCRLLILKTSTERSSETSFTSIRPPDVTYHKMVSFKQFSFPIRFFLNLPSVGGGVESKLGPLGTSAIYWLIVPAPGDCEDGEFGGMNGRGNRSTSRKPAPAQLCPPQIPLDQTRDWTRAAAVGSQRLTASAMARPPIRFTSSATASYADGSSFESRPRDFLSVSKEISGLRIGFYCFLSRNFKMLFTIVLPPDVTHAIKYV
jgi:hypothetical protein